MPDPTPIGPYYAKLRDLEERLEALTLKHGGGNGTSGGMEARVAKLEADVGHLVKQADRLAGVPADLATLKARLDALPDKDWVGAKMRNWVGGATAVIVLVTVATKFLNLG